MLARQSSLSRGTGSEPGLERETMIGSCLLAVRMAMRIERLRVGDVPPAIVKSSKSLIMYSKLI